MLKFDGISKAYGDNQVLEGRLAHRAPRRPARHPRPERHRQVDAARRSRSARPPADSGKAEWGYETWPGYFAQDHREAVESSEQSVEAWFWELVPSEKIGFVRGKLAEVLFPKDDVEKPLRALSGGEAARLVFAKLSVQKPNVLVLDEPTNHLDLEAIEALVEGLQAFDGTLILVSHDRWFVSQLANRILEITPAGIRDFPGTYDEYLERCGDDHLDAEVVLARARQEKKKEKKAAADTAAGKPPVNTKALTSRRDKLAAEIEKAETRVHAINELFCNPGYFDKTAPKEIQKLEQEQKNLSAKIDEWMSEWAKLEEEIATTV